MVTYQDNSLCLFADMDSKINIFVKHSGRCDEKNFYVDFEMTGVLVDTYCTYKNFGEATNEKIFGSCQCTTLR